MNSEIDERLRGIAEMLKDKEVPKYEMKTVLSWLGNKRKGRNVNARLIEALNRYSLTIGNDIPSVGLYDTVEFKVADKPIQETISDSILRIDSLPTAAFSKEQELVLVRTEDKSVDAISKMIQHDFSQLPVLDSHGNLNGIISWKSIGERVSQGVTIDSDTRVESLYEQSFTTLCLTDELLSSLNVIIENEVVIVVRKYGSLRPIGIITTTDLALQYDEKARLFLQLGEVEDYLRQLCNGYIYESDLKDAYKNRPKPVDVKKSSLSDFTFGDYLLLFEQKKSWAKLDIRYNQRMLVNLLNEVRQVRNATMHFDDSRLESLDLSRVQTLLHVLKTLQKSRKAPLT